MSHFVVGVIVNSLDEVDEVLERYSEEREVEKYIDMTKADILAQSVNYLEKFEGKTDEEKFELIKEMYGEEHFDEEGNFWSSYNPESKWDWYVVGGRWKNLLRLKDGGRADYAEIQEIDFSPDPEEYKSAERFWEIAVEGAELNEGEEAPFIMYKPEYFLERYKTKENYAKHQAEFSTYALVVDGEWYEQGQMGWWGCDNATDETIEQFGKDFEKWVQEADPESLFVVVDCHI